jgi:hypothetical protein
VVPATEHVPTTSTTIEDGPSPTPKMTNQVQGEAAVGGGGSIKERTSPVSSSGSHYVKTSNRSRNICNGPLTPITSTHICNGCCLAHVTYKRAKTTPGLASTAPVTNVDFC